MKALPQTKKNVAPNGPIYHIGYDNLMEYTNPEWWRTQKLTPLVLCPGHTTTPYNPYTTYEQVAEFIHNIRETVGPIPWYLSFWCQNEVEGGRCWVDWESPVSCNNLMVFLEYVAVLGKERGMIGILPDFEHYNSTPPEKGYSGEMKPEGNPGKPKPWVLSPAATRTGPKHNPKISDPIIEEWGISLGKTLSTYKLYFGWYVAGPEIKKFPAMRILGNAVAQENGRNLFLTEDFTGWRLNNPSGFVKCTRVYGFEAKELSSARGIREPAWVWDRDKRLLRGLPKKISTKTS